MAEKVDQDAGELATAIRANLYRYATDMPSYPEGIVPKVVKPYLEKAFAAGRQQGLREAVEVAEGCRLMRERLFSENEASINTHKAMQAQEIEEAITALIEGEGNA